MDVEKLLQELTNEEKAQLCSGRDFWHTQDIPRLGIEKVMMCDGPNGLRKQLGVGDALGINESIETVCYPTASAMASSFDVELMRELGESLGDECQTENVGMLLGPGINIKRNSLCGRNFEYLSEDPFLAGKMGAAYIRGLQGKGIAACVKHFACNNQENGRMSGSSWVSERTLREIYLPAFEMAVKEGGVRGVMNAYNAINGIFCAENKKLLTDILRKEWGYQGMVVTDWGAVKDRVNGLLAGLDLEMPGSTEGKTKRILDALADGSLPLETLDEAVRHVLTFVDETLALRKPETKFDRESAHDLACRFAKKSAVLLKNDGTLPLKAEQKVAFIGEFAEAPRYQGAGSSHINVKHTVSALECAGELIVTYAKGYDANSEHLDEVLAAEAVKAAQEADVAVIFAGLPESYETEGCDRESMAMPEAQNELIRKITECQPNTVVVLHCGAPVEMPWLDKVRSVLCMYLGGDRVGEAEIDLLTGRANPSGKLAESWPIRLEDSPSYLNIPVDGRDVKYNEEIYVGYRYYDKKKMPVNFCFGHGLSYTEYSYKNLKLDRTELTDQDSLTVSLTVRNTGNRTGEEVVQLYVGRPDSKVSRAVRELRGFAKLNLQPGEEKEVRFTLCARDFAYYEEKISSWFVDSGRIVVEVGASSRDIRLTATAHMCSTQYIPMVFTRTSTIGDLLENPKGMAVIGPMLGMDNTQKSPEEQQTDAAMGAGSDRMRKRMMMDMPLSALVSYGRISDEKLDGLLNALNAE